MLSPDFTPRSAANVPETDGNRLSSGVAPSALPSHRHRISPDPTCDYLPVVPLMLRAYLCRSDAVPMEQARVATIAVERVTDLLRRGGHAVEYYERCFAEERNAEQSRTARFDLAVEHASESPGSARTATLIKIREQL